MNVKYIIIHHEAPPVVVQGDRFDIVDKYHKSLGWQKIGYHYFIEKSGKIKQGRLETETGAHTIGKNDESLGICLAGNFDLEMPTTNQIKSLISLINQKMMQYGIPIEKIVPHRFYATYSLAKQGVNAPNTSKWATWDNTQPYKSCYGKLLDDNWLKNLLSVFPTPPTPKDVIIKRIDELRKLVENL